MQWQQTHVRETESKDRYTGTKGTKCNPFREILQKKKYHNNGTFYAPPAQSAEQYKHNRANMYVQKNIIVTVHLTNNSRHKQTILFKHEWQYIQNTHTHRRKHSRTHAHTHTHTHKDKNRDRETDTEREIRIRKFYSFRSLSLIKGCRWMYG